LISDNPSPAATGASSPAGERRSRWSAWVELFRPANLLTAPGDPLAGFLLTQYPTWSREPLRQVPLVYALPTAAAALLLYASGVLANDYFDRQSDAASRPERPIPSGRIAAPRVVLIVSILLAVAGTLCAASVSKTCGLFAVLTYAAICSYNLGLKRVRVVGSLNMGLCRGLSLLMGAAALGSLGVQLRPVLISAVGITLYTMAVTHVAVKEKRSGNVGNSRELPGIVVLVWFAVLYNFAGPWRGALIFSLALAILAANWTLYCVGPIRSRASARTIQRTVGNLIRGMLLIQAALAAVLIWPGVIVALLLLWSWVIYRPLADRFSPS